ncbi:cache domain-containing protein [uncultured Desulfosarcina sp.]|uniref:cache domain-containing protein n=1 Tax=uncultured Desulfosarcina sp. TaxID=218289 RepID=UPI0029C7B114|nr:cache domain-containing protein [uncultured Desulfosarcina sp.]
MRPPSAGKRSELALSFKILIPAALMFLLFIYFSYFVVLPLMENKMMAQKRQTLRSMGTAVWHLLDHLHHKAETGEMTVDKARTMALSMVKTLRFGTDGKDYCWISDLETVVLMHPYQMDLVGRRLTEHADASTRRAFTRAIDLVKASGEGFIDYQWQWQDDPSRIGSKLSYVKFYEPWGWMLGTGLYVQDVRAEISLLTRQLFALLLAVLVVSTVFCFYVYQQASTIERQRQRAESINRVLIQISNAASTTFDLDALYRSIHLSLGAIIDVSNFYIALYDRETDAISFPYYRDEVDTVYPMIGNIHRSGALTAKVIRTAATVLSTREEAFAWAASQGESPVGTPSALWLGVPLKSKKRSDRRDGHPKLQRRRSFRQNRCRCVRVRIRPGSHGH